MKITKLTTYMVPPRWLFLKIETDEGIVGWGEPVLEGRAATVAAAVDELSDYLIGQDPRNIEDLWTVMYRGGFYRGGGIMMSALAGIDQALWDIERQSARCSCVRVARWQGPRQDSGVFVDWWGPSLGYCSCCEIRGRPRIYCRQNERNRRTTVHRHVG